MIADIISQHGTVVCLCCDVKIPFVRTSLCTKTGLVAPDL